MFACYIKTCDCLVLCNQVLNPLPFLALFALYCILFLLLTDCHCVLHLSSSYCFFFFSSPMLHRVYRLYMDGHDDKSRLMQGWFR